MSQQPTEELRRLDAQRVLDLEEGLQELAQILARGVIRAVERRRPPEEQERDDGDR